MILELRVACPVCRAHPGEDCHGAVSYTHLDVYKRQIVTRHRGEIVARNNAWGGATIEFTLPRDTAMAYQI